MVRSFSMAVIPNIGPIPNIAKAGPQPQMSAIIGVNQMGGIVTRKPIPVWNVNAVPRYVSSDNSVKAVENWAESATTEAPHTNAIMDISNPNSIGRNPMNRAAPPLRAIMILVVAVRPIRSAIIPAATQAAAPEINTAKVIRPDSSNESPITLLLPKTVDRKTGIDDHMA